MPGSSALPRRRLLATTLAAPLAAALPSHRLRAQPDWPQRTIRLVVPYSPGGGTDIFTRALSRG